MKNFEEKYGVNKKIIITKDLLNIVDDTYYVPACLLSFVEI